MADSTKVVINELADFGKKTAGFGIDSGDSGGSGDSPGSNNTMASLTKGLGSPIGGIANGNVAGSGLGTNEAKTFNDWYSQAVTAPTTQFAQDLPKRLAALGGGAVVMAANYTDGDASQATAMARAKAANEVIDMFDQDPSKGIDHDLDNQQNSDKYHTVVKPLPPPTTKDDPQPPGKQSPEERALQQEQEHLDKYAKDETWPAPPKKPKTVILAPGPFDGQQPPSNTVSA